MTLNIAFLDTETTGLSKKDQAIEVTLYHNDGRVLFDKLIKPRMKINFHAQKVHGITEKELSCCPYWEDVCHEFENAMNSVDNTYIFNEKFDIRILSQTYEMSGLAFPEFKTDCAMKKISRELSTRGLHSGASISLDNAAMAIGVSINDIARHRALGDCIATQRVFSALFSTSEKKENKKELAWPHEHVGQSEGIDIIKAKVDESLATSITFSDWSEKLKKSGISVVPLIPSDRTSQIPGISFIIGNHHFSGSSIGKKYTFGSLSKRGVVYNPATEYDLAVSLFVSSARKKQKSFIDKHVGNNIVTELVKSSFEINEMAKIGNYKIKSRYSKKPNLSSPYTQLSLDEKMPKGIQLFSLAIENIELKFDYDNELSKAPSIVVLEKDGEPLSFSGDKCVSSAIKETNNDIRAALLLYFKDKCDSSIISVVQDLICLETGQQLARIRRFTDGQKRDLCTIVPSLK